MNAWLHKTRSEYANIYGQTVPAYEYNMVSPIPIRQSFPGYKGCRIEGSKIFFEFSTPQDFDAAFRLIVMQFRNRLSRKISFTLGLDYMSIPISDYPEERGEYLTTMIDLDNYFRGNGASAKLKAEYNLYRKGKDWRNSELVEQEIQRRR